MKSSMVFMVLLGIGFALQVGSMALAWEYPIIQGYGRMEPFPQAKFQPDKALSYKVVFDVTQAAKADDQVNPGLNYIARFINLMASAGIKPEAMELVAVVHGPATPIALSSTAFTEQFHRDNPNIELVKELKKAGVKLYLCSQALSDRNLKAEWVNPDIESALSAMVVVSTCQLKGYAFMPF